MISHKGGGVISFPLGKYFIIMEEEKIEIINTEPVGDTTARQELESLLNEMLPEEKRTGDVDQMALDLLREQREMNERLVKGMQDNPKLAQVFAEIVNGGNGGAALVRHFGRKFLEAQEGTPEYDEIMAAENAFNEEKDMVAKNKEAFDSKMNAFFDAMDAYFEGKGKNAEVYRLKILDSIIIPVMDGEAENEVFERLEKAVDYDKDTEDAFQAGEIKGRNTNINEMRARVGDGMPKGLGSQGVPVEKPKKPMNSLLAKALNA